MIFYLWTPRRSAPEARPAVNALGERAWVREFDERSAMLEALEAALESGNIPVWMCAEEEPGNG